MNETEYFSQEANDEDQYYEHVLMSSFLRVFKLLGEEKLLYSKLEHLVLRPDFTSFAKEAYDLKSNSILYLKGERNCKLPLDVYLNGFATY